MSKKRVTKLSCELEKEDLIRNGNRISVDTHFGNSMRASIGQERMEGYTSSVQVKLDKEIAVSFHLNPLRTAAEYFGKRIKNKTISAEEYDKEMETELKSFTNTFPPAFRSSVVHPGKVELGQELFKTYNSYEYGKWERKVIIHESDPTIFIKTDTSNFFSRHKAWFDESIVQLWENKCKTIGGHPSTELGKIADNAEKLAS